MSFLPAFEHADLLVRKIIDVGGNLSMIVQARREMNLQSIPGDYNYAKDVILTSYRVSATIFYHE